MTKDSILVVLFSFSVTNCPASVCLSYRGFWSNLVDIILYGIIIHIIHIIHKKTNYRQMTLSHFKLYPTKIVLEIVRNMKIVNNADFFLLDHAVLHIIRSSVHSTSSTCGLSRNFFEYRGQLEGKFKGVCKSTTNECDMEFFFFKSTNESCLNLRKLESTDLFRKAHGQHGQPLLHNQNILTS